MQYFHIIFMQNFVLQILKMKLWIMLVHDK
jgi:hypothetical protein